MKIKTDFVTNSSSSSFVIIAKSDTDDPEVFIQKFNQYLQDHIEDNNWKDDFEPPPLLTLDRIKKLGPNQFHIEDYVPFYSSEDDTPQYIVDLLKADHRDLSKYGLKHVSLETKDHNKDSETDSKNETDGH